MNEKMIEELGKILEYLRIGIEKGGQFIGDQAPLVVREAIAYGRAYETVWILIGVALTVQGVYGIRQRWGSIKWDNNDVFASAADGGHFTIALARTILMVAGFITLCAKWDNVLMVWFAPRIYLMQWIADLIQQTRVHQ